jgi:hypothetical protein
MLLRSVKLYGGCHIRAYRICLEGDLNLHINPRKRLVHVKPAALTVLGVINEVWLIAIMNDMLDVVRAPWLLYAPVDFNCEALAIDIDFSLLHSKLVIGALHQWIQWRGRSSMIR